MTNFQNCGEQKATLSGRISMRQFVDACQALEIFNVLKFRELASAKKNKKNELVVDENPFVMSNFVSSLDFLTEEVTEEQRQLA